jgi:hypothetical protein
MGDQRLMSSCLQDKARFKVEQIIDLLDDGNTGPAGPFCHSIGSDVKNSDQPDTRDFLIQDCFRHGASDGAAPDYAQLKHTSAAPWGVDSPAGKSVLKINWFSSGLPEDE